MSETKTKLRFENKIRTLTAIFWKVSRKNTKYSKKTEKKLEYISTINLRKMKNWIWLVGLEEKFRKWKKIWNEMQK